jgi:hypothetical protein
MITSSTGGKWCCSARFQLRGLYILSTVDLYVADLYSGPRHPAPAIISQSRVSFGCRRFPSRLLCFNIRISTRRFHPKSCHSSTEYARNDQEEDIRIPGDSSAVHSWQTPRLQIPSDIYASFHPSVATLFAQRREIEIDENSKDQASEWPQEVRL